MIRSSDEGDAAENTKEEFEGPISSDPPNESRPIGEFARDALRWLTREPLVRLNKRGDLTFLEAPGYEVHIDDFATRRGLLNWLWHFLASGKRWVTLDLLLDLVATIKGHDDKKAAAEPQAKAENRQ